MNAPDASAEAAQEVCPPPAAPDKANLASSAAAGSVGDSDGTSVVSSEPRQIFETIQRFGGMWPAAKTQKFSGSHPARTQLQLLDQLLKRAAPAEWTSKCSVGCGLWAAIPWVAFFNAANSSIQFGLYVVYLFRADMSGVYLTIGQGVSRMMAVLPRSETDKKLAHITSMLRPKCVQELPDQFQSSMNVPIDLQAPKNCGLAKNYEKSSIAWRLYEMDSQFSNEIIVSDLMCCLELVDQLLLSPEYFEMSAQLHDLLVVREEEKREKKKRKALNQDIEREEVKRMAQLADTPHLTTSAPPQCEPLIMTQPISATPHITTSAPPQCEPLIMTQPISATPHITTSAPPQCEPLIMTQPISATPHITTSAPFSAVPECEALDLELMVDDPAASFEALVAFALAPVAWKLILVQVEEHMSVADAKHTISILAAHNVQVKHLLQGLGFNSNGPTGRRREAMIQSLTGDYDSKPGMMPRCAEALVDVVIANGRSYL